MTTADILTIVRQRIGQAIAEVGGETPEYSDSFLLEYVQTVAFELEALGILNSANAYIGVTVDPSVEIVTPIPNNTIGLLLALGAATSLISDDMLKKLRLGEIGLSFSSGATQITTNQAAITLKAFSDALHDKYDLILTSYLSGDPNKTQGIGRIQ